MPFPKNNNTTETPSSYSVYVRPNLGAKSSWKYAERPKLLKCFRKSPWAADWIRREGDPSSVYYVVRDQDQRITAKWAYSPKHKPEWHTTGFENDRTGAKLKSIGDWGRGGF